MAGRTGKFCLIVREDSDERMRIMYHIYKLYLHNYVQVPNTKEKRISGMEKSLGREAVKTDLP